MEVTYQVAAPALERPQLFCDPRWVEAFAGTFGLDVEWRCCTLDGELRAAAPMLVKRLPRRTIARTPQMMTYNPVWMAPVEQSKGNRQLRERLAMLHALALNVRDAYHGVELTLPTDIDDVRGFVWAGFAASPRYTVVLPLGEDLKLHKSKKEALRQAEREDFSLHEERDLDSFFEMQRATMRRRGAIVGTPAPIQQKLYDRLFEAGLLRMFVVKAGEKPVHARLWLFDEHHRLIHGWQGVSDPDWLTRGVYTWATMRLCRQMRDEGWRAVDLGGANVESIARFKAGFGGELHTYFHVRKPVDNIVKRLLGGHR